MQSGFNVDLTAPLYRALDSRRGRRGRSAGFRCALYDNRCAAAGFPPRTSVISSISLLWLLLSLLLLLFIPLRFKPSHAVLFLQSNPSPSFSMCAAHHQHVTAALTSKPIDDLPPMFLLHCAVFAVSAHAAVSAAFSGALAVSERLLGMQLHAATFM